MEHIKEPIKNAVILSNRYILREGFPFTSVTYPANVYDAILIKPFGATSFSPRFPTFKHSIDDYVVFINKYNLDKAVVIADDISFLTKCPTLKYLNIIPSDTADNNFDFSPIFSLPELLSLCCNTEYGYNFSKKSTIDYSNVNGLVNLSMSGTGHLNSNEIKTLKSISVSDYKENNLYKLFNSIHLDTLQIVNSSIRSLEGIEQSEKLQCLDLSYNRRLEDIALLENFSKSLKYLEIVNCPKIKDLSIIEKFEKLETLKMYGKNTLPDLNFLKKLKNLKFFSFDMNVLNGDLTPCLDIERVYCARGRKHYNLKDKDLPKRDFYYRVGFTGIDSWRYF